MADPDYDVLLKTLLEKTENKNVPIKQQNHHPRQRNRINSVESLDGGPGKTPERQNNFTRGGRRPPYNNKQTNAESVKVMLEDMFQRHTNMVNNKLGTILYKVNGFSKEIQRLKSQNEDLQKRNETLLKLLLETKMLGAGIDAGQTKKKKQKSKAGDSLQSLSDQLLGKSGMDSSVISKPGTSRGTQLKIRKDSNSSDESADTEAVNRSSGSETSNTIGNQMISRRNQQRAILRMGKKEQDSSNLTAEYLKLLSLAEEKIVYAQGNFTCDICQKCFIEREEDFGVVLQQCMHTYCRECICSHIAKNEEKDIINCVYPNCEFTLQEGEVQELLSEKEYKTRLDHTLTTLKESMDNVEQCRTKGCRGFVVVEEGVYDFVCEVCHCTNCLDCDKIHANGTTCRKQADLTPEEKLKSFQNWVSLHNDPIIANTEAFDCMVCYGPYDLGEGVVLKNCLHSFCKVCLKTHIELQDGVIIKCPYADDEYSCDCVLQDREIKALLSPEAYEKYLDKSIKLAESNMKNTFHCLTPDCDYFCSVEDYPNFTCPRCNELNCVDCKAIHTNKTCRQHAEDLLEKSDPEKQADIQASETALQNLVTQGLAMICPNCGAHAVKEIGCDAIMCRCNTALCWATKGLRWGPRGTGDTSGGCRCRVEGRMCHPNCQNCH